MKTKAVLTLTEVRSILDAAEQHARAQGWAVSIAVVDDGGHALGLLRLDDAAPVSAEIALGKARTAALGRRDSEGYEDMINQGRTAFVSAPLPVMLTGGVVLRIDGQVIGAVGVSGVRPEQDAETARAGIAAVV